jgi:RNA polymerase sigma factor (sigma-70 family)
MRAEVLFPQEVGWSTHDSLSTRSTLLERLRNLDDQASWRVFFETYWKLIYNVARKAGLSDPEAEDVVQETVISVAKKIPGFRYDPAKGSFKSWLLLITRRRINDQLRRVYRSGLRAAQGEETSLAIESVADPSLGPDEVIEVLWEQEWRKHLLEIALVRARQQTNPKHYQAFDYCVFQNIHPAEVGRMLGLNIAQVYLAKHRIGVTLRRIIAGLEAEAARNSNAH